MTTNMSSMPVSPVGSVQYLVPFSGVRMNLSVEKSNQSMSKTSRNSRLDD